LGGKTFSHLINPFTGLGLTSQSQVTVVAPSAMEADSLASACLVLGPIKGFNMLETKQNVRAYFLKKEEKETMLFTSKNEK
jgi:thiamine biosynthesis lipoprotein